jgi:nanoRNase/pAp phosphatase (c-di-AMP/oligoRNAs hydrolase)
MNGNNAPAADRRRLQNLLESVQGAERVWILLHDGPDPDAMAGGMLIQSVLAEDLDIEIRITYGGIIGRPDNRAMAEQLDVSLCHLESIDVMPGDRFICVDTQPAFTNNSLPDGAEVAAVIDHHPLDEETEASFVDVRPEVGAVATMSSEYLRAGGLELSTRLATAVVYAIISETEDLGREVTEQDLRTYIWALEKADHVLIGQLRHPRVQRRFYRTLTAALKATQVAGDAVLCHLTSVNAPDELARIADILNPLAGCRWVLCTGEQEGLMMLSLRSSDPDANAERLMGEILAAHGSGGGHGMVAGGQIEIGEDEEPAAIREDVTERFLRALGHDGSEALDPLLSPPPEEMIPPDQEIDY